MINGAGYGIRTRGLHLGKVARYQRREARGRVKNIREYRRERKKKSPMCGESVDTGGSRNSGMCRRTGV